MSVAGHLRITPSQYDAKIRSLIPYYDELIARAAEALRLSARPVSQILDLGVGTGALAKACLAVRPRARVWGIDADPAMTSMVPVRLRRAASRVRVVHGSFLDTPLPRADAIVASYSLHHIKQRAAKQAFYRRCHKALGRGGVLVSGDCFPASTPSGFAQDLDVWLDHLSRTFGSRARGKRVYESWADEDVYVPLAEEIRMLTRAGFDVDVAWRRSPFAVIAAVKLGPAR